MDYMQLLSILTEKLPVNDIPELILEYIGDEIDFSSLPEQTRKNWITESHEEKDGIIGGIFLFNKRHSINDKPALVMFDGCCAWYKNGKLHRDSDLPAVTNAHGESWFKNGILHREGNRPAIIFHNWYSFFKNGIEYEDPVSAFFYAVEQKNFRSALHHHKRLYYKYDINLQDAEFEEMQRRHAMTN